jgi:MscS family membrane protein
MPRISSSSGPVPGLALALTSTLFASLAIVASSQPARAQLEPPPSAAEGRCETPRQAFYTVLYWLQPERLDRSRAAACLDRTGLSDPERQAPPLAAGFKTLLDKRDIWVRWEDVPDDPDYRDDNDENRFALYPDKIAGIEVLKIRGRWLVSRASQDLVAKLTARSSDGATGLRAIMPEWLRGDVFGIEAWQLIGLMLLIVIGVLLRRIVIYLIVHYVRRLTKRIKIGWLDRVVAKADGPVGTLVVAAIITAGSPLLQFPTGFGFVVLLAVRTLAAFSAVWLLYRLVDVVSDVLEARAAKTESKLDDQLVPLLRKSLKVFFVVIGAIFILQNLDVDVGSLLAGLGLGGLAFALAAKDTVANFFGSIMIFIDKPFQIGDWIVMSPGIEGTVEEVGFRTSRIRTFYNSVVTVPNANVTNTPIDNMGARKYRRYKATLGITYDTPPEKVQAFCEGIRAIIHALPEMRKDYYFVEFQGFGNSALEIMLYCFFEVKDWAGELRTRTLLNLEIMRLAEAMGVSFAFPTQTLHIVGEGAAVDGKPAETRTLVEVIESFGPGGEKAQPAGFRLTSGFEPRRPEKSMRLEAERSDADEVGR